jgi:hypothetical protein
MIVGVAASIKIALANLLLGCAALLWLVALIRGSARGPRAAILVPVAGYVVVSVLSALRSADPRFSITELADLLTLVLVPMTVSLLDRRRWRSPFRQSSGSASTHSAETLFTTAFEVSPPIT